MGRDAEDKGGVIVWQYFMKFGRRSPIMCPYCLANKWLTIGVGVNKHTQIQCLCCGYDRELDQTNIISEHFIDKGGLKSPENAPTG